MKLKGGVQMRRTELINSRKLMGFTQAYVANEIGVNRSYYGLIENGNRNPTLKIATKIASILNSSIEELFPNEIFFANKCHGMKQ
jgi:putative transcriptional regulator